MKQTAAKRRLRRHKTTRRYNKRRHEGGVGVGPGHAVAVALEAHHVQHSFFAMLSLATQDKSLNLLTIIGLTTAGAVSIASTAGLALVGLGIVIFTAMAIRESMHAQEKLHHTVTELIKVLRKIQKTMILCITMSSQYKVEINTHDLNVCLSKIYASLYEFLNNDAREAVKKYAENYEKESASVEAEADNVGESRAHEQNSQKPNKARVFFSTIGQSIAKSYRKWFRSGAKEQELRELMNELTPFLVLLLSQSVLQFMVCQTSMITAGKIDDLRICNDAVKQSCQYKDFQLSALLDSIIRITADLDYEPANRVSHIKALNIEVNRIKDIILNNTNYASFTVLQGKLNALSGFIEAGDYDNLRDALNDLNTYDEQAFLKECRGQTQPVSDGISRAKPSESLSESLDDKQSEKSESVSTSLFDDDNVYSNSSNVDPVDINSIGVGFTSSGPPSRTGSNSSTNGQ
jgi:hypothetical protein